MTTLRHVILAAASIAVVLALAGSARGSLSGEPVPAPSNCSYGQLDFFSGIDLTCTSPGVVTPFICEFCYPTYWARFVSDSMPHQVIFAQLGAKQSFPAGTWHCDWGACDSVVCGANGYMDSGGGCHLYPGPPKIATCAVTPLPQPLETELTCPAGGGAMIVRTQTARTFYYPKWEDEWPLLLVSATAPHTTIALAYGVPATIPAGTWTCEWRNCMQAVMPGTWSCPVGGGCVGPG